LASAQTLAKPSISAAMKIWTKITGFPRKTHDSHKGKLSTMPYYMTQASYTPESWKIQTQNPQDRSKLIGALLEASGGRLHSLYFCFGEYDIVLIAEAPDNATIASVIIAAAAGGAVGKVKTTPLMTVEEGLEAISNAGSITYTPPK